MWPSDFKQKVVILANELIHFLVELDENED